MKADLRFLHIADVWPDPEHGSPADPENFSISMQAMIGPAGGRGYESFDFGVCTPKWLAHEVEEEGYILGRHLLIVPRYDYDTIRAVIERIVRHAEGPDWDSVAAYLALWGLWEFEQHATPPQDERYGARDYSTVPAAKAMDLKPEERETIRPVLLAFLVGGISLAELQQGLAVYLTLDYGSAPDHREVKFHKDLGQVAEIPVERVHLQMMLQRYLAGYIAELDLSNWAAFIFALPGVYVPAGDTEEEQENPANIVVWDLLQKLVTPNIFGGLNSKIAQEYLKLLG
jgi:hypothetical protein